MFHASIFREYFCVSQLNIKDGLSAEHIVQLSKLWEML
jgi:hypothetical protein